MPLAGAGRAMSPELFQTGPGPIPPMRAEDYRKKPPVPVPRQVSETASVYSTETQSSRYPFLREWVGSVKQREPSPIDWSSRPGTSYIFTKNSKFQPPSRPATTNTGGVLSTSFRLSRPQTAAEEVLGTSMPHLIRARGGGGNGGFESQRKKAAASALLSQTQAIEAANRSRSPYAADQSMRRRRAQEGEADPFASFKFPPRSHTPWSSFGICDRGLEVTIPSRPATTLGFQRVESTSSFSPEDTAKSLQKLAEASLVESHFLTRDEEGILHALFDKYRFGSQWLSSGHFTRLMAEAGILKNAQGSLTPAEVVLVYREVMSGSKHAANRMTFHLFLRSMVEISRHVYPPQAKKNSFGDDVDYGDMLDPLKALRLMLNEFLRPSLQYLLYDKSTKRYISAFHSDFVKEDHGSKDSLFDVLYGEKQLLEFDKYRTAINTVFRYYGTVRIQDPHKKKKKLVMEMPDFSDFVKDFGFGQILSDDNIAMIFRRSNSGYMADNDETSMTLGEFMESLGRIAHAIFEFRTNVKRWRRRSLTGPFHVPPADLYNDAAHIAFESSPDMHHRRTQETVMSGGGVAPKTPEHVDVLRCNSLSGQYPQASIPHIDQSPISSHRSREGEKDLTSKGRVGTLLMTDTGWHSGVNSSRSMSSRLDSRGLVPIIQPPDNTYESECQDAPRHPNEQAIPPANSPDATTFTATSVGSHTEEKDKSETDGGSLVPNSDVLLTSPKSADPKKERDHKPKFVPQAPAMVVSPPMESMSDKLAAQNEESGGAKESGGEEELDDDVDDDDDDVKDGLEEAQEGHDNFDTNGAEAAVPRRSIGQGTPMSPAIARVLKAESKPSDKEDAHAKRVQEREKKRKRNNHNDSYVPPIPITTPLPLGELNKDDFVGSLMNCMKMGYEAIFQKKLPKDLARQTVKPPRFKTSSNKGREGRSGTDFSSLGSFSGLSTPLRRESSATQDLSGHEKLMEGVAAAISPLRAAAHFDEIGGESSEDDLRPGSRASRRTLRSAGHDVKKVEGKHRPFTNWEKYRNKHTRQEKAAKESYKDWPEGRMTENFMMYQMHTMHNDCVDAGKKAHKHLANAQKTMVSNLYKYFDDMTIPSDFTDQMQHINASIPHGIRDAYKPKPKPKKVTKRELEARRQEEEKKRQAALAAAAAAAEEDDDFHLTPDPPKSSTPSLAKRRVSVAPTPSVMES